MLQRGKVSTKLNFYNIYCLYPVLLDVSIINYVEHQSFIIIYRYNNYNNNRAWTLKQHVST